MALLDAPKGRTLSDLKARLGCSLRTVTRDLEALQAAGFPVFDERDGREKRWRFVDGFKNRIPPPFGLTDLMALYFARSLCRPLAGTPLYESLDQAYRKIEALLPAESRRAVENFERVVTARDGSFKDYRKHRLLVHRVTTARLKRQTLDVVYDSYASRQITHRAIDPYHLWYYQGGLYVVAKDHLRGDVRIFAVERMQRASLTRRRFVVPDDFDLSKYMESAFGIVRGKARVFRVRFDREVARYIVERNWHSSQQLSKNRDGSVTLTLKVADTLELRRWILGYGSRVEVLEPESLRRELREEAQALVDRLEKFDRPPEHPMLPLLDLPFTTKRRPIRRQNRTVLVQSRR